jgi:undecaprenyl diphosphate synthase
MNLIPKFCKDKLQDLMKNGIRLGTIGRIDGLPKAAQEAIRAACEKTANNNKLTFTIALNYGGRAEITDAANEIARRAAEGTLKLPLDEAAVQSFMYAPDVPDPDLIIRTSGELRTSNFLLWESAYSEYYFTDVLWPDFGKAEFDAALESFSKRSRRMGGR